jgi:ribonuclease BN (tRNA processing enzyme)
MVLDLNEIDEKSQDIVFKDENVTIKAIFTSVKNDLKKEFESEPFECNHNFEMKNISHPSEEGPPNKKVKQTEEYFAFDAKSLTKKNFQVSSFKSMEEENTTVSYICQTPDLPGKFDANKAKSLGLKPGPCYKDLINGKSVILEDGTVISPELVCGKTQPGSVFHLFQLKLRLSF